MLTRCDRWTRQKTVRIEPSLQLVERPVVGRSGQLPCHYVNRLVAQRGVNDLIGLDQQEPLADLDSQLLPAALAVGHQSARAARGGRRSGCVRVDTRWRARSSACSSRARFHGLQQVVDGVDLERLDGVTGRTRSRRRCGPGTRRSSRRRATSNPLNPGIWTSRNTRSGLSALDGAQRFEAVGGLADDIDAADLLEQKAQLVARELLIVDHDHAKTRRSRRDSARRRRAPESRCVLTCPGRARS